VPHVTVEVLPEAEVLSEGSVSAARHITKDSVELEVLLVSVDPEVWQEPGIIADDKE